MMHIKKSLAAIALGLSLVAGASGAHADTLAPVSPIGITGPSLPPLAPYIVIKPSAYQQSCSFTVDGAFFTHSGQVVLFVWNFQGPQIHLATASGNGTFSITVSNVLPNPVRYGAEWEDTLRAEDVATDQFSNIAVEQHAVCFPAGPTPAGLQDGQTP